MPEIEATEYRRPWGYPPTPHSPPQRVYVPSYVRDLNAMHEAEKTLRDEVRMNYGSDLQRVLLRTYEENSWLISATAHQRAEAFLRTLGKWVE